MTKIEKLTKKSYDDWEAEFGVVQEDAGPVQDSISEAIHAPEQKDATKFKRRGRWGKNRPVRGKIGIDGDAQPVQTQPVETAQMTSSG